MDIRPLTPADAHLYQILRLAGLREAPSAFASSFEEERGYLRSVFEQWLAIKPGRGSFGAFDEANLVGIVTLGRENKRKSSHKAHIWGLYVSPDARAKGAGRQLVERALELARSAPEIRQVVVAVTADNAVARHLYESLGFIQFGHEPDSLCIDGTFHDELHMILRMERPPAAESDAAS